MNFTMLPAIRILEFPSQSQTFALLSFTHLCGSVRHFQLFRLLAQELPVALEF